VRRTKTADKRIIIISNHQEREYDDIILNAPDDDQLE
jgi:hypothetical protein